MMLSELSKLQYVEVGKVMTDNEKNSTLSANARVSEAVELIARSPNSALAVLTSDDEVSGIITEKDIIVAIAELGPIVLDASVESIMTKNPIVCNVTDTCENVIKIMGRGNFRNMPIVKNKVFVGIAQLLEVSLAKMSKLIEENSNLKKMIKDVLPPDAIFAKEDDVKAARDFLKNNSASYIILEEKNKVEAIFGHVDFLRMTSESVTDSTSSEIHKIP